MYSYIGIWVMGQKLNLKTKQTNQKNQTKNPPTNQPTPKKTLPNSRMQFLQNDWQYEQ